MQDVLASAGNATVELRWAFTPDQPDSIPPEGEIGWWYKELSYRLVFTEGADSVAYAGLVDLYFQDDDGTYLITRWADKTDRQGGDHTWGWLRYQAEVEWPEGN